MITFNVLFTPGSVGRLLPFALSLLKGSGVRIRVVANGCGSDEVDLMRAATRVDERISHYVLPNRNPIEQDKRSTACSKPLTRQCSRSPTPT